MKVFHYAKIEEWNRIRKGSFKSNDIPGLGNCRRLNPYPYEGSHIGCSFSLFSPSPKEWVNNRLFPHVWNDLKNITGQLLVEVSTTGLRDNSFVVDWGHIQGWVTENKRSLPRKYRHDDERKARKAYYESMIGVDEFLRNKSKLDYSLPEVVITEVIPFKNLEIPRKQPRLDEYLLKHYGYLREEIMMHASWIPELTDWVKEHEILMRKEGKYFSKERS